MDWSIFTKIPYDQWPVFLLIVLFLNDKIDIKGALKGKSLEKKTDNKDIDRLEEMIKSSESRRKEEHKNNAKGIDEIKTFIQESNHKIDKVIWEQQRQSSEITELIGKVAHDQREIQKGKMKQHEIELHLNNLRQQVERNAS